MQRTLVIGDVHGCLDEVRDLLSACDHGPDDSVVFVGDLVAKGPDSAGVLSLVRQLGARSVRGNHDQHLLGLKAAVDGGESVAGFKPEHRLAAESFGAEDWDQLSALPLQLALPAHGALVVHAGVEPGVALDAQEPFILMNIRTLDGSGRGSKHPSGGALWASAWPGPELIVFGHHASRGLQEHEHAIGLDTGCVYGGALSALILPERRVVSVPARRAYAQVEARP